MARVDANIFLRYLLKDDETLYEKAKKIVETETITVSFEVLAEVVYVLTGVYKVPRIETAEYVNKLLRYKNISTTDKNVALAALEIFKEKNLDFVDAVLYGYARIHKSKIFTFDEKLQKTIESLPV